MEYEGWIWYIVLTQILTLIPNLESEFKSDKALSSYERFLVEHFGFNFHVTSEAIYLKIQYDASI